MKAVHFLLIFSLVLLAACNSTTQTGKITEIERTYEKVENRPPMKKNMIERYGSWEEAYADGWKSSVFENDKQYSDFPNITPTGFVVVELADGKKVRCKNPFPDLTEGQAVKIKETASGDWVITQ